MPTKRRKLLGENGVNLFTVSSKKVALWEAAEVYAPAEAHIPPHGHELAVLTFVYEGWSTVHRAGTPDLVRAPAVEFMPAGEEHSVDYGGTGLSMLAFELHAPRADYPLPAARIVDGSPYAVRLASHLLDEYRHADGYAALALEGLLLSLCAVVSRDERCRGRYPGWLRRVVDYMHDAPPATVTIARLAEEAGCSPSHLTRTFRRYLRCAPSEYLLRLRLERSRLEVERTDGTIAEVALAAGFSDHSHFTRAFRKHFGMTPSAAREAAPRHTRRPGRRGR